MAIWWRLAAVMETASLRSAAVIEPEDTNAQRAGCVEEKTNSMRQASNASAEREAAVARNPEVFGNAGARSRKVQALPLRVVAGAREQEFRGSAPHELWQPGISQPLSQSRHASSVAGSKLGLLSKALPNPSLKPRPNGKTLAPRYSAVHHLQRGASVSPSVPA